MSRTIVATVYPATNHLDGLSLMLTSTDTEVVFKVPQPLDVTTIDVLTAEIDRLIQDGYQVGRCHGWREVYTSPRLVVRVFEFDYDTPPGMVRTVRATRCHLF